MPDTSFFSSQGDHLTLRVKAKPGARQDAVLGVRGAELLVSVRAVAEKGRANAEIAKVIAKALGVPKDSIVLKLGGASPHKVFQVPAHAAETLRRWEGPA
ncbi:MAG: DUF167 domain-containing protein [Spirochaetia bacterium]|jgi:hypothetical protein